MICCRMVDNLDWLPIKDFCRKSFRYNKSSELRAAAFLQEGTQPPPHPGLPPRGGKEKNRAFTSGVPWKLPTPLRGVFAGRNVLFVGKKSDLRLRPRCRL